MTLFFMHLTKTAGGSVKEMLRESGAKVIFHYNDEPGFRKWFWYRPAPDVIYGHFNWGAHHLAQLPARYAAFFREPVSRTVSHYWHLVNVDHTNPAGANARSYRNFAEYIVQARRWEFDNFMCRQVSGVGDKIAFGKVDESVLDQAVENLRKDFVFIGIFEQLENSIRRLSEVVPGLRADVPRVHVGAYDREISALNRSLAAENNRFDMRLYEEAVRLATVT